MDWTPELKERAVREYLAASPTAETSSEIVKDISDGIEGSTVNGVRLILAKATDAEGNKVYISKASATATKSDKPATKRVNKKEAVDALIAVIKNAGLTVDDDIVGKMTGKAAVYFTGIFTALNESEE